MTLSQADRDLLARHLAVENDHRMEDTLATLTADCVFEDKALGKIFHGHQGAAEYYRMWWDAFGQTVHTEHRYYPAAGQCIVETRFKGTHVGPFLGVPATGRAMDVPVVVIIHLAGGLMTGERFYWDRATLLQQLGVSQLDLRSLE
jgi:steroid delta-isomerase-like uncharacterized protein